MAEPILVAKHGATLCELLPEIANRHGLVTGATGPAPALLWMLSESFERLSEVSELDEPKLVFFFDATHLLFDDAPKALVELCVR